MKGAKGLLISITGGRDLTLYEVDEAATRIREEVDQDANIIVGATFDESLEGIIRVSVVATGIDHAAAVKRRGRSARIGLRRLPSSSAPEPRLAELTQKLRADQQRLAERVERPSRARHRIRPPRCRARSAARPGRDRERGQGRRGGSRAADHAWTT